MLIAGIRKSARGGRDGDPEHGLAAACRRDEGVAASLGFRMLTPELAADKWRHLWTNRIRIGARSFIDLHSPSPAPCLGHTHTAGTHDCAALRILAGSAAGTSHGKAKPWDWTGRLGQHDWEEVRLPEPTEHDRDFFERTWVPRRDQAAAPMAEAFEAMKSVLEQHEHLRGGRPGVHVPDDGIWHQFGGVTVEHLRQSLDAAGAGIAGTPHTSAVPRSAISCRGLGHRHSTLRRARRTSGSLPQCPVVAVLTIKGPPAARVGSIAPLLGKASGGSYFAESGLASPEEPGGVHR